MNNVYNFVNTGIKPNKQGDKHVHFSVTIAINGKPVTKEALENIVASSKRFDEIVARVKSRCTAA